MRLAKLQDDDEILKDNLETPEHLAYFPAERFSYSIHALMLLSSASITSDPWIYKEGVRLLHRAAAHIQSRDQVFMSVLCFKETSERINKIILGERRRKSRVDQQRKGHKALK